MKANNKKRKGWGIQFWVISVYFIPVRFLLRKMGVTKLLTSLSLLFASTNAFADSLHDDYEREGFVIIENFATPEEVRVNRETDGKKKHMHICLFELFFIFQIYQLYFASLSLSLFRFLFFLFFLFLHSLCSFLMFCVCFVFSFLICIYVCMCMYVCVNLYSAKQ
jgi:hypothetical protein